MTQSTKTAEVFLQIFQNNSLKDLTKLKEQSDQFDKTLEKCVAGSKRLEDLLGAMYRFLCAHPRSINLLFVLRGVVRQLQTQEFSDRQREAIAYRSTDLMDKMVDKKLVGLLGFFDTQFKENKIVHREIFGIWAKLLTDVSARVEVVQKGASSSQKGEFFTGLSFKSYMLKKFIGRGCSLEALYAFVFCIKDLPLDEEDFKGVSNKICSVLLRQAKAVIRSAPVIVRELLSVREEFRGNALTDILSVFESYENSPPADIHQVELLNLQIDTVREMALLYQMDQNMPRRLVKLVKEGTNVTQFLLMLLLLVPQEDLIRKVFQATANSLFQKKTKKSSTLFVKDDKYVRIKKTGREVLEVLANTLSNITSKEDVTDMIAQSLIDFVLYLVEKDHACLDSVVDLLYQKRPAVQGDVVRKLLENISVRSSPFYVRALKTALNHSIPFDGREFKSSLDFLSYRKDAEYGVRILKSMRRVFENNPPLLNYLVIILKKLLFSKKVKERAVGLRGYLFVLTLPNGLNENDSTGVVFSLKRCLSQQFDIRKLLYRGITKVAVRKDFLRNRVVDILITHFQRLSSAYSSGCIDLKKCVDHAKLIDPVWELLRAMHDISRSYEDLDSQDRTEDFSVSESENFSPTEDEGRVNCLRSCVALSCYVVLIEFFIQTKKRLSVVTQLVQRYNSLHKKAGAGLKKLKIFPELPVLSLGSALAFFEGILDECDDADTNAFIASQTKRRLSILLEKKKVRKILNEISSLSGLLLQQIMREEAKKDNLKMRRVLADCLYSCFEICDNSEEESMVQTYLERVFFGKFDVGNVGDLSKCLLKQVRTLLDADDEDDEESPVLDVYLKLITQLLKLKSQNSDVKGVNKLLKIAEDLFKQNRLRRLGSSKLATRFLIEAALYCGKYNVLEKICSDLVYAIHGGENEFNYEMLRGIDTYRQTFDLMTGYLEIVFQDCDMKLDTLSEEKLEGAANKLMKRIISRVIFGCSSVSSLVQSLSTKKGQLVNDIKSLNFERLYSLLLHAYSTSKRVVWLYLKDKELTIPEEFKQLAALVTNEVRSSTNKLLKKSEKIKKYLKVSKQALKKERMMIPQILKVDEELDGFLLRLSVERNINFMKGSRISMTKVKIVGKLPPKEEIFGDEEEEEKKPKKRRRKKKRKKEDLSNDEDEVEKKPKKKRRKKKK